MAGARTPKRSFPFTLADGRAGMVREARPSDARRCLQITIDIAAERPRTLAVTEGEIWRPKDWRNHRLPWCPDGVTLVVELDGVVEGSLGINRGTRRALRHTAEFGIYVAAGARGLGLGRRLIDAAEVWASEHDVQRVKLGVFAENDRARRLYASCGYEEEGIERGGMQLPEGRVDVVMMAKEIPPRRAP